MCVCWFLYQGITQWHYICLIIRFLQEQEKTPEFESVCDKAEVWGFWFLVWLHSCLSVTIRLSQTSCLKAWDTIERTREGNTGFLKTWDTGGKNTWQKGTSLFFQGIWPRCLVYCLCLFGLTHELFPELASCHYSLCDLSEAVCEVVRLQTCCWPRTLVSRRVPGWGSPCGQCETEVTSMQRAGARTQRLASWNLAFFPELKLVPIHLLAQHSRKAISGSKARRN